MGMDPVTTIAFESLLKQALPALQERLMAISKLPESERTCDDGMRRIIADSLDLFGMMRHWLGGTSPVEDVPKAAPATSRELAQGRFAAENSLMDALVEHVDLLDSDQLRLQSLAKLMTQSDSPAGLLQELGELASRFTNDVVGVREVVGVLSQSPSSELAKRLAHEVERDAAQGRMDYEMKSDFSEFDLDNVQLDGLVAALAGAVRLIAGTGITLGGAVPVILLEARQASGLIRIVLRTAVPVSFRGLDLEALSQSFAKLKGLVFEGAGEIPSLVCEVPSSLRSMKAIVVQADGENYALPVHGIVETMRLDPSRIQIIGGQEFLNFRSTSLPLVRLTAILGKKTNSTTFRYALVVSTSIQRFGLVVDALLEQRHMVLRSLGGSLTSRPEVVGGAVDSDGRVIMVIDPRKFHPESLKPAA